MNGFGQGGAAHGPKKLPEGWFGPYVALQDRLALADNEKEIWAAVFDALRTVFPSLKDFRVWKGEAEPSISWVAEEEDNPAWPPERPSRRRKFPLSEWTISAGLQDPFGDWSLFKRYMGLIDQPLLAAIGRVEQGADLQLLSSISRSLLGFLPVEDLYAKAFDALVVRYPYLAGYGALADATGRLKVRWAFGSMPSEVLEVKMERNCVDGVPGGELAFRLGRHVYGRSFPPFERFYYEGEIGDYLLPPLNGRIVAQLQARSVCFIPVLTWGTVHGVVGLFSATEDFFTPWRRQVVEGVLGVLSMAAERAVAWEEEQQRSEGIRLLSETTFGTGWGAFMDWARKAFKASAVWLLWEDGNLGSDFWTMVARGGDPVDLPEILPADAAEELSKESLERQGLRGQFVPLERDGRFRGAWGWACPTETIVSAIPPWLPAFTEHLALTVEDWQHHMALQSSAYRDHLTGLFNRAYLEDYLERRPDKQRPLAFVIFDLDHFKDLNDSRGHAEGDEALRLVGARLWESLRDEDLAVRLGGDEFVILLEGCPWEKCLPVLKRIVGNLPLTDFGLGTSVGVSVGPEEGTDYQSLYRRADEALYQVKNGGRNGIAFSAQRGIVPLTPPGSGTAVADEDRGSGHDPATFSGGENPSPSL